MGQHHFAIFWGNYGCSNIGDDLLLHVLIGQFQKRYPEARLGVITRKAPYLERWYPSVEVIDESILTGASCDFLILGGGTQFFSFGTQTIRLRKKIYNWVSYLWRPRQLVARLLRQFRGRRSGIDAKYVAAISLGLGPFSGDSASELAAIQEMKACSWISVRDRHSLSWLESHKITSATRHADLGYASPFWVCETSGRPEPRCDIGVVVRHWPHDESGAAYLDPLLGSMRTMIQNGYSVELLSFAAEYDTPIMSQVEALGIPVQRWDPEKSDISSFAQRLTRFRLVISARAHGVVMASALGVPSVAVELEPKLRLICEDLPESVHAWGPPFDQDELLHLAVRLLDSRVEREPLMQRERTQHRDSAMRSMEEIFAWIDSRARA